MSALYALYFILKISYQVRSAHVRPLYFTLYTAGARAAGVLYTLLSILQVLELRASWTPEPSEWRAAVVISRCDATGIKYKV